MWFQDLFNYDFRCTEQCIIPCTTQEGEISFCAYNGGIGWRNIVGKMHTTAPLTKWYAEKGKQTDLDKLGIAKTAREEKIRARDAKLANGRTPAEQAAYDAEMEKLYRKHVLGEKQPEGGFVPLTPLTPKPLTPKKEEEVGSFGD